MSEFSNLLKASRFASLAKPLSRTKGSKSGPTHQIVETRASSLHRQEWGMKYALPTKIKSRYITFNDVDSMERIVDFETNASDHWKRLRFQEMGRAISLDGTNVKKNPLFHNDVEEKSFTPNATILDIKNILRLDGSLKTKQAQALYLAYKQLRPEFLQYVKEKNACLLNEALNPKEVAGSKKISFSTHNSEFAHLALTFITEVNARSSQNQPKALLSKSDDFKIKGFGGLSYQLKGRLTNTPNGIQSKSIIQGRILGHSGRSTTLAIGGFISENMGNHHDNQIKHITTTKEKHLREVIVPFQVSGAKMDKTGSVKLITSPTVFAGNGSTNRAANRYKDMNKSPKLNSLHIRNIVATIKP